MRVLIVLIGIVVTEGIPQNIGRHSPESKLNVGFAVFVSAIGDATFKDVLAVQAHGLKKAASVSRHNIDLIVLAPDSLPADSDKFLRRIGYDKVLRKPLPVAWEEIDPEVGHEVRSQWKRIMGKGSKNAEFLMADETIKYWGLNMTEYDRVLVLDSDVMVLDPMDELMERSEDFIGTYDLGLDKGVSSIVPPTQGGFLLYRPNETDFKDIQAITREGDFRFGWRDSAIGYCYGGTGPDGLLAYYFHKDALEAIKKLGKAKLQDGAYGRTVPGVRMFAADRLIYDVVMNEFTRRDLARTDMAASIKAVKSIHFTGDCMKPWNCLGARGELCDAMHTAWWAMRAEFAQAQGHVGVRSQCDGHRYTALHDVPPADSEM